MQDPDLSHFLAAAASYERSSEALKELERDNQELWERNGWRKSFDAYWSMRADLPGHPHDPDELMAQFHPELKSIHDEIDAHASAFSKARDAALVENTDLHREALAALASAMAPKLIEAADARASDHLQGLLVPIYAEASEIRKANFDGIGLSDYDPGGSFSTTLMAALAQHLGVERRSRTSYASVARAYDAAGIAAAPGR